jgi:hypothetical protein
MNPENENIRERLLSHLPQPANLNAYREEVASLLKKKEKELRREKRVLIELWTFVIVVSVLFLWLGGQRLDTPKGPYFVSLACFWFLFGMVYFVAHSINRSKVDILKEVKQVQVQVLEVQALLSKDGGQKA